MPARTYSHLIFARLEYLVFQFICISLPSLVHDVRQGNPVERKKLTMEAVKVLLDSNGLIYAIAILDPPGALCTFQKKSQGYR